MILKVCNIKEFIDIFNEEKRKIYCFGAGCNADTFLELLYFYKIDKFIEAFVDNNSQKWNGLKKTAKNDFPIISIQQMLKNITPNDIIIITCSDIGHVYEQLNQIEQLNNNLCFMSYVLWSEQYKASKFNEEFHIDEIQKIPKILHYCWFGKSAIPEQYKVWMETWKKYCPDYEIKEWNEDNYDVTKNKYMYQAYKSKKWGFVPDYARLDIIYENGGIYLDTDIELVRNMDDLLYQDAFCAIDWSSTVNLGSGFGGVKGNKLFKEMRDYYNDLEFIREDGSLDLRTCNVHQCRILEKNGFRLDDSFQRIKDVSIYPGIVFHGENIYTSEQRIEDKTISMHHGTGSWLTKDMEVWKKSRLDFMKQL